MIGQASYLAFVEDHKLTGNPNIMWWSDINWLRQINFQFPNEDIFNLWNEAAKPENPKPYAEFEIICDGINYIMNQSINDPQKRERTGYITLDNKFIFTTIGRADVTNINVKMLGAQAYYTYKINKGAPQLNYVGRLERNGEYWIPIKTSIHNHILDGSPHEVPIETTNLTISDGDGDVAEAIQRRTGVDNFRLFVIEAKLNGKYLTASFDRVNNDYTLLNNNILLNEVCNGIY